MIFSLSTTLLVARRPLLKALYSAAAQVALLEKLQALRVTSFDLQVLPDRKVTISLEDHGVDIDADSRVFFLNNGQHSASKDEKKKFFYALDEFKNGQAEPTEDQPSSWRRWLGFR